MSYESITIPLETDKKNMSMLDIKSVSESTSSIEEMYGKIISMSMKPEEKIVFDYKNHSVYQGFIDAYKNHRPITISPDIIWLLIVQGFSYHIASNAKDLRNNFVNFDNKKELVVKRYDLNAYDVSCEDWMTIFPEVVDQIKKFTGQEIIDTLTPNFTTTDCVSMSVGQISIMSAFKHYFKYTIHMLGCGLPYVTIEGSVDDWNQIIEKMKKLKSYKIDFWIDKLFPIIEKIIETKKGNVDREFWKQMIKVKDENDMYDPGFVDGWFTNFFPYTEMGEFIEGPILIRTNLASEILNVPFELKIADYKGQPESEMKNVKCEFLAGFVGMTQDEKTASMKPKIGWIIRKVPKNINHYKPIIKTGWQD